MCYKINPYIGILHLNNKSSDIDILKCWWFDKHPFPIICNDILCWRGCIDFDYLYSDHIEVCRQCQTLSWLQIVKLSLWFIKDPIHFYNGVFMKILYELECSVLSLVENVETTGIILAVLHYRISRASAGINTFHISDTMLKCWTTFVLCPNFF